PRGPDHGHPRGDGPPGPGTRAGTGPGCRPRGRSRHRLLPAGLPGLRAVRGPAHRMTGPTVVEAEPFIDGLHFGECPRWHQGRLWFVDFYDNAVASAGPSGDVRVELKVPGEPAGLGWLPDGRLLVVARKP